MSKYYRVYADVDLDIITSNVEALMKLTPESTGAIAVVKADDSKVQMFAVATLDEAVNLRENGIDKPILILGFVNVDEYETLVKYNVTASVFDYETAKELDDVASDLGMKALCHIKVDTGMRRIGLEPDNTGVSIVKDRIWKSGVFLLILPLQTRLINPKLWYSLINLKNL